MRLLAHASAKRQFSARALDRIARVARTNRRPCGQRRDYARARRRSDWVPQFRKARLRRVTPSSIRKQITREPTEQNE
ncbi:MAG: hypothetical protein ACLQHL_11245 [Candidatus Cybelea sp.]